MQADIRTHAWNHIFDGSLAISVVLCKTRTKKAVAIMNDQQVELETGFKPSHEMPHCDYGPYLQVFTSI